MTDRDRLLLIKKKLQQISKISNDVEMLTAHRYADGEIGDDVYTTWTGYLRQIADMARSRIATLNRRMKGQGHS